MSNGNHLWQQTKGRSYWKKWQVKHCQNIGQERQKQWYVIMMGALSQNEITHDKLIIECHTTVGPSMTF